MVLDLPFIIIIIVVSLIILIVSIGIILSIRFQNKQKKKYNELIDIVNKKKDITFRFKDSLTKEDINKIDSSVNVDELMKSLYDTYLKLENNLKRLDNNFDNILTGFLKEFYINKVKMFKDNNQGYITDNINLIGYSITEFNKSELKFRININCVSYRMVDGKIVSGNNIDLMEQILVLTYKKIDDKWLISSYDKIYEKKLSN